MCRKAGQKFSALMRLSIPSYEEKENNVHYQGQISVKLLSSSFAQEGLTKFLTKCKKRA